jgi:hypothetical protein
MYAAHSTAASALTAHVAASAANQQHRAGPGAHNQQGGSSSSSRQEKPVRKEDYVEVEKSNMVMLVSAGCIYPWVTVVLQHSQFSGCEYVSMCLSAATWWCECHSFLPQAASTPVAADE